MEISVLLEQGWKSAGRDVVACKAIRVFYMVL